jgi:hypothetical protein
MSTVGWRDHRARCNPRSGINEPPDISRSVLQVMIEAENCRRH